MWKWKTSIFLGNDLVWLDDPVNRGRSADLLLVRRVLTPRERLLVQVSNDPDRMLWSLWAAKEAAFKALSREIPLLVFSPVRFEVDPNREGVTALVTYDDQSWPVVWTQGPCWVHAVVAASPSYKAVVEPRDPGQDEGAAVRDLALRAMVREGYPPGTIEGRPPWYRSDDVEAEVSLSHDGPYLAAVFPTRKWTTNRQP